jgi:hypothetical protein
MLGENLKRLLDLETNSCNIATDSRCSGAVYIGLAMKNDRTVYAAVTALFGVAIGFAFVFTRNIESTVVATALTIGVLAPFLLATLYLMRTTRTVPVRSKRLASFGRIGSFLAAITLVIPLLDQRDAAQGTPLGIQLVAACGIALPSLIAAAFVMTNHK